jgi:hypothetical protein
MKDAANLLMCVKRLAARMVSMIESESKPFLPKQQAAGY